MKMRLRGCYERFFRIRQLENNQEKQKEKNNSLKN